MVKDIALEVEAQYQLLTYYFAKLKWENLFNLPNLCYENLVHEFYANVEDKQMYHYDAEEIVSTTQGTYVCIHRTGLLNWLKVSNKGFAVHAKKAVKPNDFVSCKIEEAVNYLKATYRSIRETGRHFIMTYSVKDHHQLLMCLFSSNIIPLASGTNKACISDVYFLDKTETRLGDLEGIPLESIITNHMWAIVRRNDETIPSMLFHMLDY